MTNDLVINVNTDAIKDLADQFDPDRVRALLESAAHRLSVQGHALVLEKAAEKLKSRHHLYAPKVYLDDEEPGVFAIVLPKSAMWIEEGMGAFDMHLTLLQDKREAPDPNDKSGAVEAFKKAGVKTSKDGNRYRVIPFDHGKAPTQSTPAENNLRDTLKSYMKQNKIPWKAIERDSSGTPKEGLLHKFNIDTSQRNESRAHTPMGPGMQFEGVNPEGPRQYRERNTPRPVGAQGPGGRPFLWGVRVYQKVLKDKMGKIRQNAKGEIMASRSIMTFRVISSKHLGSGKWMYPGIVGVKIFDEVFEDMKQMWDREIEPDIISQIIGA